CSSSTAIRSSAASCFTCTAKSSFCTSRRFGGGGRPPPGGGGTTAGTLTAKLLGRQPVERRWPATSTRAQHVHGLQHARVNRPLHRTSCRQVRHAELVSGLLQRELATTELVPSLRPGHGRDGRPTGA